MLRLPLYEDGTIQPKWTRRQTAHVHLDGKKLSGPWLSGPCSVVQSVADGGDEQRAQVWTAEGDARRLRHRQRNRTIQGAVWRVACHARAVDLGNPQEAFRVDLTAVGPAPLVAIVDEAAPSRRRP